MAKDGETGVSTVTTVWCQLAPAVFWREFSLFSDPLSLWCVSYFSTCLELWTLLDAHSVCCLFHTLFSVLHGL